MNDINRDPTVSISELRVLLLRVLNAVSQKNAVIVFQSQN